MRMSEEALAFMRAPLPTFQERAGKGASAFDALAYVTSVLQPLFKEG